MKKRARAVFLTALVLYATGNTIKAIKTAIENVGGIIKGEGVIMNIKELNNDTNIYSLLEINEE